MADFERYLLRLREHLVVPPRRAEEILAETYSHLAERARQLIASGLSEEEGEREAERVMGDPAPLAAQITRANSRHRMPSAWRALAATGVIFASALALAPTWHLWTGGLAWLTRHTRLSAGVIEALGLVLCLGPAAVLTGHIGGRRYWWAVFTPMGLIMVLVWGDALLSGRLASDSPRFLFPGLVLPLTAALWTGPIAYGASRFDASAAAWRAIGLAAIIPYALMAAAAVAWNINGVQGTFTGMVIAEGAAVAVVLATYSERRISRHQLFTWLLFVSGASALALGATVVLLPLDLTTSGTIYGALIALAVTAVLAAVTAALKVREAKRPSREA